jgi:hypothetical protein
VGVQIFEVQFGQFLLGWKWPMSRAVFVQDQDTLCEMPVEFFFQNILQMHRQRWVIFGVDILALWKIISEKGNTLIPKARGEKFSSGRFTRKFFAGRAAMTPLN